MDHLTYSYITSIYICSFELFASPSFEAITAGEAQLDCVGNDFWGMKSYDLG